MKQHTLNTLPIAIDIILFSVMEGRLNTVLMHREDADIVGGAWALPGALLGADETPEETAVRVTRDRIGADVRVHLEQLATFGALDRDPRGRSISIAYLGLLPARPLQDAVLSNSKLIKASIMLEGTGLHVADEDGQALKLAFDHADIIEAALRRLRGKIDYTPIGLSMLPKTFTLRDVQDVWEAVLNTSFAKPPFRRKLLDRNIVEETGAMERGTAHRPAKLYRPVDKHN